MRRLLTIVALALVFHCNSDSAHAQLFQLSAPFSTSTTAAQQPAPTTTRIVGSVPKFGIRDFNSTKAVTPPVYTDRINNTTSGFSLSGMFKSFNLTSFGQGSQGTPTSNLPPPSSFASTRYPNSFQPVAPIIPR